MTFHRTRLAVLILTSVAFTTASLALDAQGTDLLHGLEGSPMVALYHPAAPFHVVTEEVDTEDWFDWLFREHIHKNAVFAEEMGTAGALTDPAQEIMNRFVAALKTRTGLTDIQMIEEAVPPLRYTSKKGQAILGDTTVLYFRVTSWGLYPYTPLSDDVRLRLNVTVGIVRAPERASLWEARCTYRERTPKAERQSVTRYRRNRDLLRPVIAKGIEVCTAELLETFSHRSEEERD